MRITARVRTKGAGEGYVRVRARMKCEDGLRAKVMAKGDGEDGGEGKGEDEV